MQKKFRVWLLIPVIMIANQALGSDAWVLRFRTDLNYFDPPCRHEYWVDELLFHNTASQALTVRLIDSTFGTTDLVTPSAGQLTLLPSQTRSSAQGRTHSELGGDALLRAIVVNHLDVPEGVTVGSRAGVYTTFLQAPCDFPGASTFNLGSLPLPVIRQLVPANQPQIHLGADLGIAASHTNVIAFNGGTRTASVRIEYRAACDDALLETRVFSLEGNSVAEIGGITASLTHSCHLPPTADDTTRYVTVVMDQPGFSHVMTVSDERPVPTIGVTGASPP